MQFTSSILTIALLASAADPALSTASPADPASRTASAADPASSTASSVPPAALPTPGSPASIVPSRAPSLERAGAGLVITGGALWTIGMLTPPTPADPGSHYGDAPGGLAVSLSVGGLALAAVGGCLIWIAGELSRWLPGEVQLSSSVSPGSDRTRWTLELRFP